MTTEAMTRRNRVTIPEGEHGRARISRFTIAADSIENRLAALKSGRGTAPGQYTALHVGGRLWMSDTDAEWRDHSEAIARMASTRVRRVLINGLGIGMVVQAALNLDHIEHVDVVELDPDVAALVGPHYEASGRVTVHVADAYAIAWPTGTAWDLAWHDIWADLCVDNLTEMTRLHRKYGRRVDWQGSWGRELLKRHQRQERRYSW